MYGRRQRPEVVAKRITQVPKTCAECGRTWMVKRSHAPRRRSCSRGCMAAWQSRELVGEKSRFWRGGYAPYYGPTWHAARRAARERDKVCQRCGTTPEQLDKALDVHHVVPFKAFDAAKHAEANRLDNLVCLCATCHLLTEWAANRSALIRPHAPLVAS